MKAVQIILLLCLIASFNCDILSFLTCLMGRQNVLEICTTLFDKIKNQEKIGEIIMYVAKNISALADAIKSCPFNK